METSINVRNLNKLNKRSHFRKVLQALSELQKEAKKQDLSSEKDIVFRNPKYKKDNKLLCENDYKWLMKGGVMRVEDFFDSDGRLLSCIRIMLVEGMGLVD